MSDQTILVPLDGSELSERALPYARLFAKALGARLLLLTVWEGAEDALSRALPKVAEDVFQTGQKFYTDYLLGLAKKYGDADLRIDAEVLTGHPAEQVLQVAEERRVRMLVLASHGRSGLGRWWFGSVANDIVRRALVPTLVIGPKVLEQTAKEITHGSILVPLDASPRAEEALDSAAELADKFGAEIVLAQVLSWAGEAYIFGVPNVTVAEVDQELTKAAEEYLEHAGERIAKGRKVRCEALHGMPAEALIDLVEREKLDLIVLTSHGRGAVARAALGSVADRLLQAPVPVLVIRTPPE